jgi:hypothetical protein
MRSKEELERDLWDWRDHENPLVYVINHLTEVLIDIRDLLTPEAKQWKCCYCGQEIGEEEHRCGSDGPTEPSAQVSDSAGS